MPFTDPTFDDFTAYFPELADVNEDLYPQYLLDAKRVVDQSWTEGDYMRAIELYIAHLYTMQAMTAASGGQASQGIQSESLGPISVTYQRDNAVPASVSEDPLMLQSTTYGQQFAGLLAQNRGGARVTGGFLGVL